MKSQIPKPKVQPSFKSQFPIRYLVLGIWLSFGLWSLSFTDVSASVVPAVTLKSNISLTNGLVGHWTFDGKDMTRNIADASGTGNTGNLILGSSGNTSTSTTPGRLGQALKFDGVDDHVNMGDITSLDGSTELSIAYWLYRMGDTSTGYNTIVNKDDALESWIRFAGAYNYFLTINGENKNFGFGITPKTRVWTHVVMIWQGGSPNDTRKLYVDGVLVSTITTGTKASIDDTAFSLNIGGRDIVYRTYGSLDDIRIYNRALSASEVARLYNLGATTHVATTIKSNTSLTNGLVGHWTFDGKDYDSQCG